MKFLALCFLVLLISCGKNDDCKTLYVGSYKIDTNAIGNRQCLEYVRQFRWDTVTLISEKSGNYFIETEDQVLKEAEGKWKVSSANIDGDCIGYIKQNNQSKDVSVPPFYISIRMNGESYTLPFRKINRIGHFVNR